MKTSEGRAGGGERAEGSVGDELEMTGWKNKREAGEVTQEGAGHAVPRNPGSERGQVSITEEWDLG